MEVNEAYLTKLDRETRDEVRDYIKYHGDDPYDLINLISHSYSKGYDEGYEDGQFDGEVDTQDEFEENEQYFRKTH